MAAIAILLVSILISEAREDSVLERSVLIDRWKKREDGTWWEALTLAYWML